MKKVTAATSGKNAKRGAENALEPAGRKKAGKAKKNATKARETANKGDTLAQGKPAVKKAAVTASKEPREGSKKAEVLALLGRKEGATMPQLMKATGWQKHSVRGFLSGALGKKMGLVVTSAKGEDGERIYRVSA